MQILQLFLQTLQMLILILQSLKISKLVCQLKTYIWILASENIKTGSAKSEIIEESIPTGGMLK